MDIQLLYTNKTRNKKEMISKINNITYLTKDSIQAMAQQALRRLGKEMIIHKLCTSNRLAGSFAYQLCKAYTRNTIKIKELTLKDDCKFYWKEVTCVTCLKMKCWKRHRSSVWY